MLSDRITRACASAARICNVQSPLGATPGNDLSARDAAGMAATALLGTECSAYLIGQDGLGGPVEMVREGVLGSLRAIVQGQPVSGRDLSSLRDLARDLLREYHLGVAAQERRPQVAEYHQRQAITLA